MNIGYLLLLFLGLFWTLVAITLSEAKSKNCNIFIFYFIGSLLAVILLFLIGGIDVIRELTMPEKRFAILCFVICSILNGTGQGITMWNLKKGGRALAYAIPQLAFLLPFIWSIFFWNQHLNWRSGGGIFLIVAATVFLSVSKKKTSDSSLDLKRVLISCGAMLICGISQIMMITPTQLPAEKAISPLTGACVIQAANALFFLILIFGNRITDRTVWKISAKYGILWGLFATGAYCVLPPALRILGEIGQSGIVFAVGCGMTIALFTLFTVIRYRENQSIGRWIAFGAVIAGVILVRI